MHKNLEYEIQRVSKLVIKCFVISTDFVCKVIINVHTLISKGFEKGRHYLYFALPTKMQTVVAFYIFFLM